MNMYKVFKEMSSEQIKEIINDLKSSKEEGTRPKILTMYAKVNSEFEKPLMSMSICLDIVKDTFIDVVFDRK